MLPVGISSSFLLLLSSIPLCTAPQFVHDLAERAFGCFQFLMNVNQATETFAYRFWGIHLFSEWSLFSCETF